MKETVEVNFDVDTSGVQEALKDLGKLSESFGSHLTGALRSAVAGGRELEDVLRRLALNLAGRALDLGLAPLKSLMGAQFSGLFSGLLPYAQGGVPGRVIPFASGGVVSAPTFFPAGRNLGLMGEAGAEAILPLRRAPDGRLGVAAGGGAAPVNIVFQVTAQDATSFRKSEAQIAGMLARAVSRGTRRT